MPSRRGPAPIYCSPAHRQAAYRQRLRERRAKNSPAPTPNVPDALEAMRGALREASDASSWAVARRILARAVEKNPGTSGREKP